MAIVAFKLAIAPMVAAYMIIVPLVLDMDQTAVQYAYFMPICYLLGSIPWGYLLTQTIKGMDVREYGSGSTGTSNVLRTAGGTLAAAALVLDASKGVLAVLLARVVADTEVAQVAAGLAALVGHNWPIFLDFKGGRGIATGVGGLLMMSPLSGAIAIAVFLPITLLTRYLSLGSICARNHLLRCHAGPGDGPRYLVDVPVLHGHWGSRHHLAAPWQHSEDARRYREQAGQTCQED